MKYLIIEEKAQSLGRLKLLIKNNYPNFELLDMITGIDRAQTTIKTEQPELIFTDILLLRKTIGFDFYCQKEKSQPYIIFICKHLCKTSSTPSFQPTQYLLEPVSENKISEAILRVLNHKYQFEILVESLKKLNKLPPNKLAISTKEGIEFIPHENIIFCKAEGSYTRLYLTCEKQNVISKSLGKVEIILSENSNNFCRTHRSYIINTNHIQFLGKGRSPQIQLSNGNFLEVSRTYKEKLVTLLNNQFKFLNDQPKSEKDSQPERSKAKD